MLHTSVVLMSILALAAGAPTLTAAWEEQRQPTTTGRSSFTSDSEDFVQCKVGFGLTGASRVQYGRLELHYDDLNGQIGVGHMRTCYYYPRNQWQQFTIVPEERSVSVSFSRSLRRCYQTRARSSASGQCDSSPTTPATEFTRTADSGDFSSVVTTYCRFTTPIADPPSLDEFTVKVVNAYAIGGAPVEPLPQAKVFFLDCSGVNTSTSVSTTSSTCPTMPVDVCGDPTADGDVTASDALFVLQAAVGMRVCALGVCDVASPDGISATDALYVLNVAVDAMELGALRCPY